MQVQLVLGELYWWRCCGPGAKQVLAEAHLCGLTDPRTGWRCHLKVIHVVSIISERFHWGSCPGREPELTSHLCGCCWRNMALGIQQCQLTSLGGGQLAKIFQP